MFSFLNFDNCKHRLIKSVEDYITITWVGQDNDIENLVKALQIDESNTRKYDGSSEGLTKSLAVTRSARQTYTSKVKAGEDVTTGFYKDII